MDTLLMITLLVLMSACSSVCLYIWCRHGVGKCISKKNLTGKTVAITGANTGLGYYTALDLAKRNAKVILICRNMEKGREAMRTLKEESGNDKIFLKIADLAILASVRNVAEEINSEESRLDILINNAGVSATKKIITEDGLEHSFATNHFGPFLLTNLLLDLLKKSAPSRIVVLSSNAQKLGNINFDNLCAEKCFTPTTWYFDTKLANVLFTKHLAKNLQSTGVTVNCLHPGCIYTQLFRNTPAPLRFLFYLCSLLFFKTPVEGAQTAIHCAISEDVEGVTGKYFMDCRQSEQLLNPLAHDEGIAKKLWEVSEKLTGLRKN